MASSPAAAPTDLHCRPTTAHHGDWRVGLLYIIYSHQATSDSRSLSYLQQALRSVRTVSKHNPDLPTALATNLLQSGAGAAEAVLRGPAGNGSFTLACDMHGQQPGENHWSPRLRALRSAPFELTLEVDASVTVCSPQLHGALLAEWTRDRLDFAVNFEMVPLAPPSPGSTVGPPPCTVADVSVHCFSMLIRRGPGGRELLRRWLTQSDHHQAQDDQQSLHTLLRALHASGFRSCGSDGCVQVRVMKLTESVGAIKWPDKLVPGWRNVWPAYTRPISGDLLLLHSHEPRLIPPEYNRSICGLLNADAPHSRLMVQSGPGRPYQVATQRARCAHALSPTLITDRASAAAAQQLCSWLPTKESGGRGQTQLVEPLSTFWSWLEAHKLTAPNASAECTRRTSSMWRRAWERVADAVVRLG